MKARILEPGHLDLDPVSPTYLLADLGEGNFLFVPVSS